MGSVAFEKSAEALKKLSNEVVTLCDIETKVAAGVGMTRLTFF